MVYRYNNYGKLLLEEYLCFTTKLNKFHCESSLTVASAPTGFKAVQQNLTSIHLFWNPPTPLGDTTGYRIYYSGGSSDSKNVSVHTTTHEYLLTGLQNGASYNICIVGTSDHLPSDCVCLSNIILGELFTTGVLIAIYLPVLYINNYRATDGELKI